MGKTDKELAAEITVAMINANPKAVSQNGSVSYGVDLKNAQSIFKGIYSTIHSVSE